MREYARIDRILKKLKRIWKATPDQRLGQRLININMDFEINNKAMWELEDDLFEEMLDDTLKEMKL